MEEGIDEKEEYGSQIEKKYLENDYNLFHIIIKKRNTLVICT